jgi:hypothetical protein
MAKGQNNETIGRTTLPWRVKVQGQCTPTGMLRRKPLLSLQFSLLTRFIYPHLSQKHETLQ